MKTFKVTFFDKELDVFNVLTYHNVINQSAMLENIAILIDTLDLHTAVKAETEGKSYTQAVNNLLEYELADLRNA